MSVPEERPYQPAEYDQKIRQTIPFSREIYAQSLSMIQGYGNTKGKLMDVGCGAGMFEYLLRETFPELEIAGIDPAEDMLKQAVSRQVKDVNYLPGTVMDLPPVPAYDIVTALMSHHFVRPGDRKTVSAQVFHILKPGGIYIAFENVIPEDAYLKERELERWARYQVNAGKSEKEAAVHKARCGVFYFPLSVPEHIALLKDAGFEHVYVFWRSYMQMGILGIKGSTGSQENLTK